MTGPDTFSQAAAAFLDFDNDSDIDDNDAHLSHLPHQQPWSERLQITQEPKWKGDARKKRFRPKQEDLEMGSLTKQHSCHPTTANTNLFQMPVKNPFHPQIARHGIKNEAVHSSVQYMRFAQWIATEKAPFLTKPKQERPKTKSKRSKARQKWEWESGDETEQEVSLSPSTEEAEGERMEDVHALYGCSDCHYAWEGCAVCRREEPMVQRPKIVWDPVHPHYQSEIPPGPVYHPTAAQFADPFQYIAEIRPEAEKFGICVIVPPASWTPPPDPLEKMVEDYEFYPKRQLVTSLSLRGGMEEREASDDSSTPSDDDFGFVASDMPFSFRSFKAFAEWAHHLHFNLSPEEDSTQRPTTQQMEGEFWRLVESGGEEEFETFYGSDLDASRFPTAFHQAPTSKANFNADWHVSMWPRSKDSVLKYLPEKELINGALLTVPDRGRRWLAGVMIPWVYFGSSLSAFCWHIEDHALYSINYLHKGGSKVWYAVPSCRAADFEAAMRDAFPKLFEADKRLLHRLVTHLSPVELRKRGVPVFRIVHTPGSFVITFPHAYHGGFNCGWNCAEAVNFAPPDWLPYGTDILAKYKRQQRPTNFSHDSLLLHIVTSIGKDNANPIPPLAVKYATGELYLRTLEEAMQRTVAQNAGLCNEMYMCGEKGARNEKGICTDSRDRDCEVCKCDLYLSAVVSPSHPEMIVCPEHISHLPPDRTLIFRHSIAELEKLIEDVKRLYPDAQDFIKRACERSRAPEYVPYTAHVTIPE